jgi:hypothetical protein
VKIGLDPIHGLCEVEPNNQSPTDFFPLWGEDRSSGSPAFVRLIQRPDENVRKAIEEIEALARPRSEKKLAQIPAFVVKAMNLLMSPSNAIRNSHASSVLAQTKQDDGSFASPLHRIDDESKRTKESFEAVVKRFGEKVSRSPRDLISPPDPWHKPSPEQLSGLTMMWYTLVLLDILVNPCRLTQADLENA